MAENLGDMSDSVWLGHKYLLLSCPDSGLFFPVEKSWLVLFVSFPGSCAWTFPVGK